MPTLDGLALSVKDFVRSPMTKAESNRNSLPKVIESSPEVDCVAYRSSVYKISMVRMSILADTLTNLRMYGSTRRLYRNVQVR